MKLNLNSIFARLFPFVMAGIFITLFIVGLIIFSYILLWGAAIGLLLFIIAYIRNRFFDKKNQNEILTTKHKPRTYDHQDF